MSSQNTKKMEVLMSNSLIILLSRNSLNCIRIADDPMFDGIYMSRLSFSTKNRLNEIYFSTGGTHET
jgi:hypothetical protein